jgi:hypothetical protein
MRACLPLCCRKRPLVDAGGHIGHRHAIHVHAHARARDAGLTHALRGGPGAAERGPKQAVRVLTERISTRSGGGGAE